jgi:hypothetical protein
LACLISTHRASGHEAFDTTKRDRPDDPQMMFAFFSNRLGCLGSLGVSIMGSLILILVMRGCSSPM